MNDVIDRDFFFRNLVEINNIESFHSWFFYCGMLFGSTEKWWGQPGKRPAPHEGLDIGLYRDSAGRIQTVEHPFNIPVTADGEVIEISDDDLLGKSIFVRHDITDMDNKNLHSVYAHSTPSDGLKVNDRIEKGCIIGTIADISERNLMIAAHLHISMIWLPEKYPRELLKWQLLPGSDDVKLADPFEFFDCKYTVENYLS